MIETVKIKEADWAGFRALLLQQHSKEKVEQIFHHFKLLKRSGCRVMVGSMDLRDMRQRLALATEAVQREFTKEPSLERSETGATAFDFGRTLEQIQGHTQGLQQIVDFGIEHGFQKIRWM